MSAGTVLAIAVPVLLVLAAVAFVTTARRRDGQIVADLTRETRRADRSTVDVVPEGDPEAEARERYARIRAETEPGEESKAREPLDPEELGITRRQLFNRGMLATAGIGAGGLGAAVLAFLWPSGAGGFGSMITAGNLGDIRDFIETNKDPFYIPDARSYLTPYPASALEQGKAAYDDRLHAGMEAGLLALFQTCPHLGCRVPWCDSSQWFECPCHGSKYNRVGEKRGGPAPRGMDSFPIEIQGERVTIDTGTRIIGPEIGTNTTGQEPEGPHCV